MSYNLDMNNYRILNVSDSQGVKDAANKGYVYQKANKTISTDLNMNNHKITNLDTPNPTIMMMLLM